MKDNLYIPAKIKVGFQRRKDTFTGKLSYITFIDEKGVQRKKESWEQWIDNSIQTLEIDNTPQNGFLFNKGIQRDGYYFGGGRSVIRVYDPRDFEFEITVDNLMGILMHSDISKRDIQEKCVFAWAGKDLVLLPVNSAAYQNSIIFTEKQSQSLSTKELVVGHTYSAKKTGERFLYLGYMDWYRPPLVIHNNNSGFFSRSYNTSLTPGVLAGKKHVFYSLTNDEFQTPGIARLVFESDVANEKFSTYLVGFKNTFYGTKATGIIVVPATKEEIESNYYGYFMENGNIMWAYHYEHCFGSKKEKEKFLKDVGILRFTDENNNILFDKNLNSEDKIYPVHYQ